MSDNEIHDPNNPVNIPEDFELVKEKKPVKPSMTSCVTQSGFTGTVRRLRVKELNILSNREFAQKGTSLSEFLKSVWVETTDVGIYKPPFLEWPKSSDGQPVIRWDQVLIGDRTHILLDVRKLTKGSEFSFEVNCNNRQCRKVIPWTVDLDKLDRHGLSEEAIHKITEDGENLFYRTLPYSGQTVAFKLFTGSDEVSLANISNNDEDDVASRSLLLRLPYIEGASSPRERKLFVDNMDTEDAEYIQAEWEDADIYIQQELEVQCPHCWKNQRIAIPFDNSFFWGRSSRKSRK